MKTREHTIQVRGQTCMADFGKYDNGRLAIQYVVEDDHSVMAILTVNLPDADLAEDEFAIKNWTENVRIAAAAMASGIFEDTGKTIRTGFVEAPVWRFKKETKEAPSANSTV